MSKSYGVEDEQICKLLDRITANDDFWNGNVPEPVQFQRFGFQLREVDFEKEPFNKDDFPLRNRNQAATSNSGLSKIKNGKNEFEIHLDVWPFEKNDLSIFSLPGKYIYIHGEHGERDEDGSSVSRKFRRYYRVPQGSVTDTSLIKCEYFSDKFVTIRVPKNEVPDEVKKVQDVPMNLASCRNIPIPTDKQYNEEMPEAQVLPVEEKGFAHDLLNKITIATEDSKKEESSKSEGEQESTEGVSDITEDSKKEESSKSEIKLDGQSPEGLSDDFKIKKSEELLATTNGDSATDLRAN